jgi:hypothetical protein
LRLAVTRARARASEDSTSCSIGACGSAALSCGKARLFRAFANPLLVFGEATPRRFRRSLNLGIYSETDPIGKAFPQDRAAEPLGARNGNNGLDTRFKHRFD